MAGLYGGIRSIIGNLLPSVYDKVKKNQLFSSMFAATCDV